MGPRGLLPFLCLRPIHKKIGDLEPPPTLYKKRKIIKILLRFSVLSPSPIASPNPVSDASYDVTHRQPGAYVTLTDMSSPPRSWQYTQQQFIDSLPYLKDAVLHQTKDQLRWDASVVRKIIWVRQVSKKDHEGAASSGHRDEEDGGVQPEPVSGEPSV